MIDTAKIDELLIEADELNAFLRDLIKQKGETDNNRTKTTAE